MSLRATAIRPLNLSRSVNDPELCNWCMTDSRKACWRWVPVEVPVLQAMALSHEGQRLRGVEHLTPGGESAPEGRRARRGSDTPRRRRGSRRGRRTRRGSPREVVDGLPGRVPHGPQGGLAAGLASGAFQLGAVGDAFVGELLLGLGLGQAVGLLDLDVVVAGDAADRDPVVAGYGEATTRLSAPMWIRIRVLVLYPPASESPACSLSSNSSGKLVALLVLRGVQADQQDVHRPAAGAVPVAEGPGRW